MSLRFIIHIDMDAFFASVEQHDDPSLRGRPVVVGGASQRGVVAAASYEARLFGVRSAMPGWCARRLCPDALFVPPRFERYKAVSAMVFSIFQRHTEVIEGLSLDEAYLDVSASVQDADGLKTIGRLIKQQIAGELGLTASVGMAHNKLLAKLASDYDNPDGLVYVSPDSVQRFMDPLPIRRLPGLGPRTAEPLYRAGILTIGQLRRCSPDLLAALVGHTSLQQRAAGIDERPVSNQSVRKSISQESTFDEDVTDSEDLFALITQQAAEISLQLRKRGLLARTAHIKVRSASYSTMTRSCSLIPPTDQAQAIAAAAQTLLAGWMTWHRGQALRLLGTGVSGLSAQPTEGL